MKKVTDGLRTWIRLHLYKAPNMERSLTKVADEIDAQVQTMPMLRWHAMADERPQYPNVRYLIIGKRGAMYMADGFIVWKHSGRKSFYIPNNRDVYKDFNKIKAWTEIPEYVAE